MMVDGQVTVTWGSNPFPNGSRLGVTINAGSAPCVGGGSTTGTTTGSGTSGTSTTTPVGTPGVTALYFAHPDHLGTPRAITKPSDNTVVWKWDNSDAFGANLPNEDPANTGTAFKYNLRFPGQYADVESGTFYNYFRDYDSTVGRYVQSDPIGLRGGANTYAYVGGNPLSRKDSLGLYIEGFYEQSTGHLFLYDYDSGAMISGTFESGGKPFGDPAPQGMYAMLNTRRDDFFRLDPFDAHPYDDINQSNNRTSIRLHKPGLTMGCIAATESDNWEKIKSFIRNTKTKKYVSGTSLITIPKLDIVIGNKPDSFTEYGILHVVP